MTATIPILDGYDVILVNTSAGKDSQAMLDYVVGLARERGLHDRVVAVHADLGRVEWEGTAELAVLQAAYYGVPCHVVRREQGDLLDNVVQKHRAYERAGKRMADGGPRVAWPDAKNRWCTSEHKTAQCRRVMTRLVDEASVRLWGRRHHSGVTMPRPIRILSCLGIRAAESPRRARRIAELRATSDALVAPDTAASNGKRRVDEWLPIATWSTEDVWARVYASGTLWHPAYDGATPGDRRGMPRLSCSFCVLASRGALLLAAQRRPALAREYIAVERLVRRKFRADLSMEDVVAEAARARVDTTALQETWCD